MVAYSFKKRFGPPILAGTKAQTIRMEAFMREDGFESVEDIARFWWAEHPPEEGDRIAFEGVLIRWQPLIAVSESQAA